MEMIDKIIEGLLSVSEIVGLISMALIVGASCTGSSKVGKVATKMQKIGDVLNVVGFDLKTVFTIFNKKK